MRAVGESGSVGVGDVAVLAVDAAHPLELRRGRRPGRGRGALLRRLEAIVGVAVLVHPARGHHLVAREVALERRHDPAGMRGERAHAGRLPERVELDGEQRVGGLRLPVRLPLLVAALELQVVPVDAGALVAGRAERDHARAAAVRQQRPQQVGEREVTEVVGGELRLPARPHPRLRAGHDRRVVDEDVDAAPVVEHAPARTPARCRASRGRARRPARARSPRAPRRHVRAAGPGRAPPRPRRSARARSRARGPSSRR